MTMTVPVVMAVFKHGMRVKGHFIKKQDESIAYMRCNTIRKVELTKAEK